MTMEHEMISSHCLKKCDSLVYACRHKDKHLNKANTYPQQLQALRGSFQYILSPGNFSLFLCGYSAVNLSKYQR